MQRNHLIIGIIILIVVAGLSFWTGTHYASSQTPGNGTFGRGGGQYFTAGGRGGAGGSIAAGQILSISPTSLTLELASGSSEVVYFATSTQVLQTTTGSLNDLSVGVNVAITGTSNSDGSLTAENIQIRPARTGSQAPMIPAGGTAGQ
ncbi:MAG: hypothetical protein KGJ34_02145 [Patescibacteria group bacterium]|nr:hypothetical protein [Patescibacteria group bacterium]